MMNRGGEIGSGVIALSKIIYRAIYLEDTFMDSFFARGDSQFFLLLNLLNKFLTLNSDLTKP